jgi:hypothetical protein
MRMSYPSSEPVVLLRIKTPLKALRNTHSVAASIQPGK